MKDLFHFLKLVCLQRASVLYYISRLLRQKRHWLQATFRPGLGADTRIVTLQEEVEDCNLRTAPAQPGQASWSPSGGDDGDWGQESRAVNEPSRTFANIRPNFMSTYLP